MKKAIVAVLVVLILMAGLLMGCTGRLVTGSGDLKTEEKDFSEFTRVEASHGFEVEIIQSDSFGVSVTTDDNLLEYVRVSKSDETLKIDVSRGGYSFNTLEARITMPDL